MRVEPDPATLSVSFRSHGSHDKVAKLRKGQTSQQARDMACDQVLFG